MELAQLIAYQAPYATVDSIPGTKLHVDEVNSILHRVLVVYYDTT